MRFVSVLGAIGVGLAIGSAAVLAPLTMSTPGAVNAGSRTASSTSSAAQWATQWGHEAINAVRSLSRAPANSATRSAGTADTPVIDTARTLPGQDARTIDYIAHPTSGAAKVADARIAQTPWTTQVTIADSAVPKKQTSSKPSSDEQRQSLVHDLQAELKRVGCYEGEPNGQWGAASKRAMATFTERVNASLPFEQPDFILLTLVQGHKGRACGQDCPSGQGLADNGRCMPNSILAQAERTKQGDGTKRETAASAVAVAATAALATKTGSSEVKAKPRVIQQAPSSIASTWATATLEAPIETGSIAATAAPAPVRITRPQQTAAVGVTILPGRMSIGAPLPPASEAAPVPAVKPVRPADARLAAADTAQPAAPATAEPVTATIAEPTPRAKRVIRSQPVARAQPVAPVAPHVVKRAPEHVVVRRPPPPPRHYTPPQYAGNTYGNNVNGSKSRRMVYEMFQRPDRN